MEILLIACMFAWAAGAQSEQARLGLSPAQRAVMREQTRHEKAVRKIGEKHGHAKVPANGVVSPWKEPPSTETEPTLPAAFLSGWREQRPAGPPLGHRAGARAGQGVSWIQGTGRDAWRAFVARRKREGRDGPEFVTAPLPPQYPPAVPPMPATPPPVTAVPEKPNAPPDSATEPATSTPPEPAEKPEVVVPPKPTEAPPEPAPVADEKPAPKPTPEPEPEPEKPAAEAAPEMEEPATTTPPVPNPTAAAEGSGRMAVEVTYDSVMDESDELTAMCDDDLHTYDRIKKRAEKEIGKGDTLAAQILAIGFGQAIAAKVARCTEQYQVIYSAIDDLKANTVAQSEAVVIAKNLLEQGQGVYAAIAKDMPDVAKRPAYISDAIDADDANPEAEIYETKAGV